MLEISGIAKSYQQNTALRNVSFQLNEGEIYTLLGPNGAGKSTLIRILNRILESDAGWIKYKKDLFKEVHLKDFGYLPEERGLYGNMTVEEHGLFLAQLRGMNKREARQLLNYWLERFQIVDWRKKRIQELSKGMAQKIQFIYTVLHQPKVIILDEPFSGFDPLNVELMKKEILHLKEEGRAILISTHNMNSVEEIGDRGMLIHQGKTVLEGSITEMRKQKSTGEYTVRFSGSMISFVNALWTGFEILEKRELPDNRHEVDVKVRNENTINELMHVLINQVEVEAIETKIPRMHDVFVQAITNANTH